MNFIDAILLGILQGATEFLPVSSSGHLVLAQHLIEGFEQPGVLFDVLLHIGTMIAVMLYFRRDLVGLVTSLWRTGEEAAKQKYMLTLLVVGSVPTAIIGLVFKDFFVGLFERPDVVCIMLLATGSLLWIAERLRSVVEKNEKMSYADAILVGIVQGCAIIPGVSRSGSTIAALLLRGVDGEVAARFSFLLALPAVFGAALLSLNDLGGVTHDTLAPYLLGTLAAMVIGLLCIHLLMGVIRRRRLHWFAFYCWFVGGIGWVFFF